MKENKMEMKENKRHPYVTPCCETMTVSSESSMLAASPAAGTTPSVIDPDEDNEDTELSGAKRFGLWDDMAE